MKPALVIALPQGLTANGITAFAVRLLNALVARGYTCGVIVHPSPRDAATLDFSLDPRVRVFGPQGLVPLESRASDIDTCLPVYRAAIEELARDSGGPVALAPSNHGDCFGIAAALSRDHASRLRIVGWQHSDNAYDAAVLSHYERVIHRFVPVSTHLEQVLRARLPQRAADIHTIHCGVEVPDALPLRSPLVGRAINLIYTGRLEHQQKRVLALPSMMREFRSRRIDAWLRVVGDGPAMEELRKASRDLPEIEVVGAVSPSRVASELEWADAFVLPSRYEGLSVAMLEAMARGCVPIVARTESGVLEAIEPGRSGIIVEATRDADEGTTGRALAAEIERLCRSERNDVASLSRGAFARVKGLFSLSRHVEAVETMLSEMARREPRAWPMSEPCAFSSRSGAGSGSVPHNGADRLARLLDRLRGRTILVHGTGQHTRQLEEVFLKSGVSIAAFVDDDRQQWGGRLWGRTIVAPDRAATTGATDVVLSSWMHQESLWSRRAIYESQGLRVHRLYP